MWNTIKYLLWGWLKDLIRPKKSQPEQKDNLKEVAISKKDTTKTSKKEEVRKRATVDRRRAPKKPTAKPVRATPKKKVIKKKKGYGKGQAISSLTESNRYFRLTKAVS